MIQTGGLLAVRKMYISTPPGFSQEKIIVYIYLALALPREGTNGSNFQYEHGTKALLKAQYLALCLPSGICISLNKRLFHKTFHAQGMLPWCDF